MNTFVANSTVNRQEAEALKEMIFNRVRARAEAMNKEAQESYTTNIQNDVMDLARTSFVSNKNPFSQPNPPDSVKLSSTTTEEESNETSNQTNTKTTTPEYEGLGFSNNETRTSPKSFFTSNHDFAAQDMINQTMLDAKKSMEKNTGFIGALDFLNSQASITLVSKKGRAFEATA